MNFLDFIHNKRQTTNDLVLLNEAFETKKINTVLELIESLLRKHLDNYLIPLKDFIDVTINGEQYKLKAYVVTDKKSKSIVFTFNWKVNEKSSEIYSISFFDDLRLFLQQESSPLATINTLGKPIVKILPLIWEAINNNDYSANSHVPSLPHQAWKLYWPPGGLPRRGDNDREKVGTGKRSAEDEEDGVCGRT